MMIWKMGVSLFVCVFFRIVSSLIETSTLEIRNTIILNSSLPCHIYELPANFQILNIKFKESQSPIKRLMISDQPNNASDICDDQAFATCNENSSYCLIYEDPEPEFSHAMGVCTDNIYLHVYSPFQEDNLIINETQEVNIGTLVTSFNFSRTCSSHLSKEEDIAMECATLSHEQCYSEDECDERCQWISCTYNSFAKKDFFKEFTFCLPSNIYAEDKICYEHYDYVNSPNRRFSFKKCGYPLNSYKRPGKEGFTAGTVAIIVLLVLVLLFVLSIFYYRWSISQRKVAPFTPPSICPEWIYPKIEIEHPRKYKELLPRNEYKPPDE